MTFDDQYWAAQRLVADAAADAAVTAMMTDGSFESVRNALGYVTRNSSLLTDSNLPPDLRAFLAVADDLPPLFDIGKIAVAQRVFADFGVEIAFVLLLKSLPECYTMQRGAVVLETTGRLLIDDGRESAYIHRVMMTLEFVANVMATGGFSVGGQAIESLVKVRLIHACIRHYIREQLPDWDTAGLGVPINQEDLVFTLTTFSVSVINGLRQLGITLTPDQCDAVNHLWAVAATMFGITPTHIPQSYPEAEAAQQYFFRTQGGYSEAGVLLTQSLVEFTEGILPGLLSPRFVRHVAHLFLGERLSEYVGLQTGSSGRLTLFDRCIRLLLKIFSWLVQRDNFIGRIARRITGVAIKFVMRHFTGYTNIDFELPETLQDDKSTP